MNDLAGDTSDINHIAGLDSFIDTWNSGRMGPRIEISDIRMSRLGNINIEGSTTCVRSLLLSRWHPDFPAVLEEGVKSLVLVCVSLGWITYSSCAGHPTDGVEAMRLRQVGIIPRDEAEEQQVVAALVSAAKGSALSLREKYCRIKPVIKVVRVTSDATSRRGIDLVFAPIRGTERQYFEDIELAYSAYLNNLRSVGSRI